MEAMLEAEYGRDVKKVVRSIERLVDKYDELDQKIARLELSLDQEIEDSGPKSRKTKKLMKDLGRARKELASLQEDEAKLSELSLLSPNEQPVVAADAEGNSAGH